MVAGRPSISEVKFRYSHWVLSNCLRQSRHRAWNSAPTQPTNQATNQPTHQPTKFVCLFACLLVCVFVYVFVCVFVWWFVCLFWSILWVSLYEIRVDFAQFWVDFEVILVSQGTLGGSGGTPGSQEPPKPQKVGSRAPRGPPVWRPKSALFPSWWRSWGHFRRKSCSL